MAKKIKIGNAILCEYVAQGSNNKHMIVNMYGGNVVISSVPGEAVFGLYVEVEKPNDSFEPHFAVLLGDRQLFEVSMPDLPPGNLVSFVVQTFQVTIEGPTHLSVYVSAKGFARTEAMRKEITVGPIPSGAIVSRLLSAQSPPAAPAS